MIRWHNGQFGGMVVRSGAFMAPVWGCKTAASISFFERSRPRSKSGSATLSPLRSVHGAIVESLAPIAYTAPQPGHTHGAKPSATAGSIRCKRGAVRVAGVVRVIRVSVPLVRPELQHPSAGTSETQANGWIPAGYRTPRRRSITSRIPAEDAARIVPEWPQTPAESSIDCQSPARGEEGAHRQQEPNQ
jgi:hypothetical protein